MLAFVRSPWIPKNLPLPGHLFLYYIDIEHTWIPAGADRCKHAGKMLHQHRLLLGSKGMEEGQRWHGKGWESTGTGVGKISGTEMDCILPTSKAWSADSGLCRLAPLLTLLPDSSYHSPIGCGEKHTGTIIAGEFLMPPPQKKPTLCHLWPNQAYPFLTAWFLFVGKKSSVRHLGIFLQWLLCLTAFRSASLRFQCGMLQTNTTEFVQNDCSSGALQLCNMQMQLASLSGLLRYPPKDLGASKSPKTSRWGASGWKVPIKYSEEVLSCLDQLTMLPWVLKKAGSAWLRAPIDMSFLGLLTAGGGSYFQVANQESFSSNDTSALNFLGDFL